MRKLTALLTIITLTLISAGISTATERKGDQKETENGEKAKYIFLFIGDGMGATHVATAESYLSYKEGKFGGVELTMTQFPYYGTCTTYSANYNITCSAAAGTAIACGEKTNNGTIGINKDGENVTSIAYTLQDEGYKIGIMSSVPVNHATPASFYAHSMSRSDYYNICQQIPGTEFELFAGAGFLDYNGKNGGLEPTDTYLEKNGYTVSYGAEEFKKESKGKDKMVFCQASNRSESADNYVSDGKFEEDITLAQMVELGIDYLGDKEPFFIMCEGGTIDWAGHDNRTMSMVTDVISFDEAVAVAYEFYKKHPEETLIIVTADHETGGLTLGCGDSAIHWKEMEESWIADGKKDISSKEENKKLNDRCSIGWTTTGHTGGPVPVFAIGKGAETFNGRMDNTEIKSKILGK